MGRREKSSVRASKKPRVKLSKETLKDLDAGTDKTKDVKGGSYWILTGCYGNNKCC